MQGKAARVAVLLPVRELLSKRKSGGAELDAPLVRSTDQFAGTTSLGEAEILARIRPLIGMGGA
jgi:hypothetical protein